MQVEFLGTGLPSACRGHRKGPVLFKRCQVQQDPHGEVWGAFSGGSWHDYVHPSFWRCLSPLCLCVSLCVFCLGVHLIQHPLPLFMSCLSRLPQCLLLSAVPALTLFLFLIFTLFSFSLSHVHSPTLSVFLYWLLLSLLLAPPSPSPRLGASAQPCPADLHGRHPGDGRGFRSSQTMQGPRDPLTLGRPWPSSPRTLFFY